MSFSPLMQTGCTFDRPARATRGLSLARRFSATSKAYSRPVERIIAPSSRVLPPAPAQKSDHHLAALRRQQVAEQLAALVLHFDLAVEVERMLRQRRPALEADAERRVAAGLGLDAVGSEPRQHVVAGRLERIHAQVERRRLVETARQRQHFFRAHARRQTLDQPVRADRPARRASAPVPAAP